MEIDIPKCEVCGIAKIYKDNEWVCVYCHPISHSLVPKKNRCPTCNTELIWDAAFNMHFCKCNLIA